MTKYPMYLFLATCSLTSLSTLGTDKEDSLKHEKILKCLEHTAFQTESHIFNVSEYSKPSEQVLFVSKDNINDMRLVTFPKPFVFSDKKEEVIYKISNFGKDGESFLSNSNPALSLSDEAKKADLDQVRILEAKVVQLSYEQVLSRFESEIKATANTNLEYYRRALEAFDYDLAKKYYNQIQGVLSNCKNHQVKSIDMALNKVEARYLSYLNKSKDREIAWLGELERKNLRSPAQEKIVKKKSKKNKRKNTFENKSFASIPSLEFKN